METDLIRKARLYAENIFRDRAFEQRSFHNIEHTQDVVRAVEEIANHSGLTTEETESAIIAAWLHDIGYVQGAENHEQNAAVKTEKLLKDAAVPVRRIADITDAIIATKIPQQPRSLIAKVLCDADLYHLSTEQCTAKADKLRSEWQTIGTKTLSDKEWIETNLAFMEQHHYHTAYGQNVLHEGKKRNIKKLRKLLRSEMGDKEYEKLEEELAKLRAKLEKQKSIKPDRGIETMFRTTSHNHLMLSQMADTKANILITINSIILSVVVSVLVRKLEDDPRLVMPTILLVAVCLTTTVFAILATRPNISSGRFTREDIKQKQTNLLFFGNFHGMSIDEYEWSMKEMMKDGDYLYGSMIKDIYYLGIVLGKKYKLLRIAYNIFMFGFVVAILSFIGVFMSSPKI